jgi:acetylornithine deacetylase/succinyl-diaminopimelate desuccinylase-like protein
MADLKTAAIQYAHDHQQQFLEELKEFVSIPSISTEPDNKDDVQRAAQWVAGCLKELGVEKVQVFPTARHPIVYGEYLKAGPSAPVALIYGHYDVQPAEPLDLWQSEPFQAQVRGENLYARGATDMKGQVLAVLDAIEAIIRTGSMPVNLKFIFEGEEEIGSPNLSHFIPKHKELLACDFAVNPDTGMIGRDQPTITYGLRGLAYYELRVYGPDHDLHSGQFGGGIHNPAQAICELIAGMHDDTFKVTLPGFYDKVRPISPEEHLALIQLPGVDEASVLKQTGAPAIYGEAAYAPIERISARPTLEVNGLLSGYTGSGSKTVLPAWAMAKISMRLVPDQDPDEVEGQLRAYLQAHAPKTIRWEVINMQGGPAAISDRNSLAVKAMVKAFDAVWGRQTIFRREGGSVPVVAHFQQHLKVETVNTGFSLPDDNMHGPNEKLHLPTWYKGIDTLINFFYFVADSR